MEGITLLRCRDANGAIPMHYAAWLQDEEMVEALLCKNSPDAPLTNRRGDGKREEKKEELVWHRTAYDTLFLADLQGLFAHNYASKQRDVPSPTLMALLGVAGKKDGRGDGDSAVVMSAEAIALFEDISQKDADKVKEILESSPSSVHRFSLFLLSFPFNTTLFTILFFHSV